MTQIQEDRIEDFKQYVKDNYGITVEEYIERVSLKSDNPIAGDLWWNKETKEMFRFTGYGWRQEAWVYF